MRHLNFTCTSDIPLYISQSKISTEVNKTGTWRYMRPIYVDKTAPCSAACPAGEDIPKIEMLVSKGFIRDAWETILMENPFPAVCGRVCFHPCETSCNRSLFDQAVAIHCLERFIGDVALANNFEYPFTHRPKVGKRIAIVGAGPAGLSAAYFLTRLGYDCDIYEKASEPGGLLRWGIPAYRLPESVLKQEISRIERTGVFIHCNKPVTQAFMDHASKIYHAVIMASGYGRSITGGYRGEEYVQDGLAFLNQIRKGDIHRLDGTAAVIGGGNTAIDTARSLVRLGAKPLIIYRRRKEDMPAFEHEVQMAISEGVRLLELLSPVRIQKTDKGIQLTLQKMKIDGISSDGRARIIPDDQTDELMVDTVYSAIGAEPEHTWQIPPTSDDQSITLSHCCIVSGDMPIGYCGDLTNDIKSVTDAIASGKQVAMGLDILFEKGKQAIVPEIESCKIGSGRSLSMEVYLGGIRKTRSSHVVDINELNLDYFQAANRVENICISIEQSSHSFDEVEQTYTQEQANTEVKRCFQCGLCNDCDNCNIFCPEMAVSSGGKRQILLDYCKGCGICVVECPRNAMILEEEKE